MTDDGRRRAQALNQEGHDAYRAHDWHTAEVRYSEARDLFVAADDDWGAVDATTNLANVAWRLGRPDEADELYERAAAGYNEIAREALRQRAVVWMNRGNVAQTRGDFDQAVRHFRAASEQLHRGGFGVAAADVGANLAIALYELGRYDDALETLHEVRAAYEEHLTADELLLKLAETDHNLGVVLDALDRHDDAQAHYVSASQQYEAAGLQAKAIEIRHNLGQTALHAGELVEAKQHFEVAARYYREAGHDVEAADVHLGLGAVAWRSGDDAAALAHYARAAEVYRRTQQWLPLTWVEHNIGIAQAAPEGRLRHLVPAWLAMHGLVARLGTTLERASWRARVQRSTDDLLEEAFGAGQATLLAEVVEALRGLVALQQRPAGATTNGDVPQAPPPLVECGWPSVLARSLPDAQALTAGSTFDDPLRRGTVRVIDLLR